MWFFYLITLRAIKTVICCLLFVILNFRQKGFFKMFYIKAVLISCVLLAFPVHAETIQPRQVVFRKNPHLSERSQESDAQSISEDNQATVQSFISPQAKQNFCINVRGWMVPTEHFFSLMSDILIKNQLSSQDKQMFVEWFGHGFGYAIARLVEDVRPKHLGALKALIDTEYPKTNVICPLICSYSDYTEMALDISKEYQGDLHKICRPNCLQHYVDPTDYEQDFCRCLLEKDTYACQQVSAADRVEIKKANHSQSSFYRQYRLNLHKSLTPQEGSEAFAHVKNQLSNGIKQTVLNLNPAELVSAGLR